PSTVPIGYLQPSLLLVKLDRHPPVREVCETPLHDSSPPVFAGLGLVRVTHCATPTSPSPLSPSSRCSLWQSWRRASRPTPRPKAVARAGRPCSRRTPRPARVPPLPCPAIRHPGPAPRRSR